MRKLKRRILSGILSAAMLFTMLPAASLTAYAEDANSTAIVETAASEEAAEANEEPETAPEAEAASQESAGSEETPAEEASQEETEEEPAADETAAEEPAESEAAASEPAEEEAAASEEAAEAKAGGDFEEAFESEEDMSLTALQEDEELTVAASTVTRELTKTKTVTLNNDGTYNLSLAVSGAVESQSSTAAVDILLIVDTSGSMGYELGSDREPYRGGKTRLDNVRDAVVTLTNSISENKNIDARYSIVTFATKASVQRNWTNNANDVSNTMRQLRADGGTNYQAGIYAGKQQLQSARNNAQTVVIFLTDGVPTYRGTGNQIDGNGQNDDNDWLGNRKDDNINAAVSEIGSMGCTSFYAIGAGDTFADAGSRAYKNLESLCTAVNNTDTAATYSATDTDSLNRIFARIAAETTTILCSKVTVTDPLSSNVNVVANAEGTPTKLTVTVTDENGKTVKSGSFSVTMDASSFNAEGGIITASVENKTVKLSFPENYVLEPGYTYTVTTTIKATEAAYENYRKNNNAYPNTGDAGTGTYAKQSGLYSNDSAVVTYSYKGENKSEAFSKPVVQIDPGKLVITKTVKGLSGSDLTALKDSLQFTVNLNWTGDNNEAKSKNETVTLSQFTKGEDGVYTYTIAGLSPDTKYTVTESGETVKGYTVDKTSSNNANETIAKGETQTAGFTNTYTPEKISVQVNKVWSDGENQDGKRPESVTVKLLAGGQATGKTVTLNDENSWTASFTDLNKYANGTEIQYTVSEDSVEGYTAAVTGSAAVGYTITNSHTPETTSVTVTKKWSDADNQDGLRPESVAVTLYADGISTDKTLTLNAENNWQGSFTGLAVNKGGTAIKYTVKETAVKGYTSAITGDAAQGYVITNTHTPETISVSGTKTWNDANNQDGKRPESITVNLLADGQQVRTQTVTASADGSWSYTFDNLAKFANGQQITYTVQEAAVEGYTSAVDGYNLTNTHKTEKITVSGHKFWSDDDNKDGKRPDSITVNLLANGEKVASKTVTAGDNWSYSFADLDKYKNGREIAYTITENAVAGYTTQVDGYNLTNIYVPEKKSDGGSDSSHTYANYTVKKIWQDNGTTRPASVDINLYRTGGEYVETVTLTEANGWSYTWNLDESYQYAVSESNIPNGYIVSYTVEGNTMYVTNTYSSYGSTAAVSTPASSTPKTGDSSNLALWAAVMAGAMGVLAVVLVRRKRNH